MMMMHCRYSLEDTCELLQDLGFHDTSLFVQHSVTGSDLLDLSEPEMQSHLQLSPLQASVPTPLHVTSCLCTSALPALHLQQMFVLPAHAIIASPLTSDHSEGTLWKNQCTMELLWPCNLEWGKDLSL